ncbi:PDZ domain-containing protein, partial [Caulobacter sp. 17J80-11]|uniref:PDZ domain-containing protein n=1 Tax=Caulobacter sp. 17J80-11 TaxID=2763502 RepID=UPI001653C15B
MRRATGLAVALAAVLGCGVGTAQAGPDVFGAIAGVRAPASAAAPAAAPAWFGAAVRATNTAYFRSEVLSVEPGSPAAAAGLRPGDQLASVQKSPKTLLSPNVLLPDQASLDKWLAGQRPGATFELTYVRGAQLVKAPLTLAAAPPARKLASAYDELCRPGAELASAQACAALKADAARAARTPAPA